MIQSSNEYAHKGRRLLLPLNDASSEFYSNRKREGVHGRLGVTKEPKDGRIEAQHKQRYEMASVAGYFGEQPRRYYVLESPWIVGKLLYMYAMMVMTQGS